MKYICLGYIDEDQWEAVPESDQETAMDECFAYDDVLRKNGNFAGGEALESARKAITLRWQNGKISITDGPYAETKEQLGGILILEARDLNHAIQLLSEHPGVKVGPFEIRPAADLSAMVAASERRRATQKEKALKKAADRGEGGAMPASENSIQVSQFIRADPEKVFEAWTDAELVRKWLCPEECFVVTSEAEVGVGGRYRESMQCGWKIHTVLGTYREIVPGQKLVFTHKWDEPEAVETVVVVNFIDSEGGCEVRLSQEGFSSAASAKSHEEGWASALRNLARQFPGNGSRE